MAIFINSRNVHREDEYCTAASQWTLYSFACFVSFALLYSVYFKAINPLSIGKHYLYISSSFWLNFIILWLVASCIARSIFYVTRAHPRVGAFVVGLTACIITVWLYVDTQLCAIVNIHLNRFALEALLQKNTAANIGIDPSSMIVSTLPVLVYMSPHLAIRYLSQIAIYPISRKALVAVPLLFGLLACDKLAYGYFYYEGKPFVFELKNSQPFYPTLPPYFTTTFYERFVGKQTSTFQSSLDNESSKEVAGMTSISYPAMDAAGLPKLAKPYNVIVIVAESLRAEDLPLLNLEWAGRCDGGIPRQGVKGGRSPAKRTLDALNREIRWPMAGCSEVVHPAMETKAVVI